MRFFLVFVLGCFGLLISVPLSAHPLAPSGIQVTQDAEWRCQLEIQHARVRPKGSSFTLELPGDCEATAAGTASRRGDRIVESHHYRCSESLAGRTLEVRVEGGGWPGAFLTVQLADGTRASGLLTQDAPALMVVSQRTSGSSRVLDYCWMGVAHLLSGADHILFLLGLLWLVRLETTAGAASPLRRTLLLTSAFTVGHSLTLSAAALGWVALPRGLVEVGIALSLVLLALDIVHGARAGRTWPVVLGFGLLHGFGFASGLSEAGLEGLNLVGALLGFAIGLELAQVALVLGAFVLARLLRGWRLDSRRGSRALPGYALGAIAAMWCLERAFLGG